MKLNYEQHGGGRPIVLLHAFPLSRSMWRGQIAPLVAAGWRVITPDFPGFGDTALNADVSRMEDLARSIAHTLSELKIERAVIAGLSMGGYAALNFARFFPEKIMGLILADTSAAADTAEKRQSRFEVIDKISANGAGILTQEMLPKLISDRTKDDNPSLVEDLKNVFENVADDGAIAALRGMAERRDHSEFLENIAVPTLLIFGADDQITDLEQAKILNKRIQNSQLIVIRNAGHYSNLEQPERFNRAVTDFLEKL